MSKDPKFVPGSTKYKCNQCKDILFSKFSGDFVQCSCGESFVDQTAYYERLCGPLLICDEKTKRYVKRKSYKEPEPVLSVPDYICIRGCNDPITGSTIYNIVDNSDIKIEDQDLITKFKSLCEERDKINKEIGDILIERANRKYSR